MISFDYTVIYQMILFIVVWLILTPILFRPYLRLVEERERRTAGTQHESADLVREGERLKAEYDQGVAQAQVAAAAAKEAIVQQAREQRDQLIAGARAAATRALEQARQDVQRQLEKEKQLALTEAAGIAEEMVSKILGRRVA
jgi:F-type H+-transporting ATPase subunit b